MPHDGSTAEENVPGIKNGGLSRRNRPLKFDEPYRCGGVREWSDFGGSGPMLVSNANRA